MGCGQSAPTSPLPEGQPVEGSVTRASRRLFGVSASFVGELDPKTAKPHGQGKSALRTGSVFKGHFNQGKADGDGTFRHRSGSEYQGTFRDGKYDGWGTYRFTNGNIFQGVFRAEMPTGPGTMWFQNGDAALNLYEQGMPQGEGVRFSSDRRTAWRLKNGKKSGKITFEEAKAIAAEVGLPVPGASAPRVTTWEPGVTEPPSLNPQAVRESLLKVGFGTYGYENGDRYTGPVCEGKPHGIGTKWVGEVGALLGSAEVSKYVNGVAIGEGVRWNVTRDEAWKLVDGEQASTISLEAATEIATKLGVITTPSLEAPRITHWQPGVSVEPQDAKEDATSAPTKARRKSARSDI